jgi:RNA polymerase sigma-70 factor, ECF subfamily
MTDESQLLEAARAGDENAFALLVGPYQAQLRAHCYRMLGSVHDAEDALQETMLRAWSGLARFEGRSPLRSWLYRIATNASLRMIEKRPKRVLPIDYGPAADPHVDFGEPLTGSIWLEPYPDAHLGVEAKMLGPDARYEQRESIELAFAAAYQHLPARQRAVLILRDVLGFSARETAETLEMTPGSVDSALQRAHKAIEERVPAQTQQATLRALGDSELREIVNRFADAWEHNDVEAVVAMLADDARMTMPPWPSWYGGREAIAIFLRGWPLSLRKRWHIVRTGANGQPAVAGYLWDEQTTAFRPETIIVLTLQAAHIEEITAFRSPELFPRFGLPEQLNKRCRGGDC